MSTPTSNTTAVAKKKKKQDITAYVMKKVEAFQKSGELNLPKNYSPENAIKGAQLILTDMKKDGKPVLDYCTQPSIANALFKMVTMGLSVVKKQGNFIVYGQELQFQEEYTGNIALAKRYGGLAENPKTNVIYEGDDFEFEFDSETGKTKILKHKPSLESLGNKAKIKGAYCIYKTTDGQIDVEVMNIEQIENSWKQGAMKGNSPAHKNFPDQMCKKTVINRAMKLLVRGSDDAALFDEFDENNGVDPVKKSVDKDAYENANAETIDVDAEEVIEGDEQNSQTKEAKKESTSQKEENADQEGKPERLF